LPNGSGAKADWTYAICIQKFYSYGRHCVYDGEVTETECNPNGFIDGFDFTDTDYGGDYDAGYPPYNFFIMDRETSHSMYFGYLREEMHADSDCWATTDADTKFLFEGNSPYSGQTITSSVPVMVIEIDADTSADSETSAVRALKVCFPIDTSQVTQAKVCTMEFYVV
jgi:hypothetical protein